MVSVEEEGRDVLRFIWADDITQDVPDLKVYRFAKAVWSFLKPIFFSTPP